MTKVRVEQGWLEGEKLNSVTGDEYYSFKGIPYAAPPVGKLRFKAPQPAASWEGVRKATHHGPVCPQFDILSNKIIEGDEDCLYLNVYTTDLKPPKPRSVMLFIHGGGYKSGSGDVTSYGPDFLVKQDIVLVTINYRLEVLGFLSLQNDDVPGNAGLKDQVAALRWVNKNIENFGGDPNNVTVFGESAGGASTTFHVLSPMSKGLFHRAIPMSGVAFCDWSIAYNPRKRAFTLGKQLGINTSDDKELLDYLQSVPVTKLLDTNPTILIQETVASNILKMYHFTPVVEKDTGSEHFLTDTPDNLLRKGKLNKVDIMLGYTSEEALIAISIIKPELEKYEMFSEMLLPRELLLKATPTKALELSDRIRAQYFGAKPIDNSSLKEMLRYASDTSFIYNIHRFMKLLPPSDRKLYLYRFSCLSERNIYGIQGTAACPEVKGAAHLDDLVYLFDPKHANLAVDVNSESYKMVLQTCALFANFAKYGDPTPKSSKLGVVWPQYDAKSKNYLDIGKSLTPGKDLDESIFQFWQSIYDEVQ